MKKYTLFIVLLSICFPFITNASYNQDDLNTSLNNLKAIENGNIYVDIVDNYLLKNISNLDKMFILKEKIENVRGQIEGQTKVVYNNFRLILDYLEVNIDIIIINNQDDKIIIDDNIIEEDIKNNENEEVIYPGFLNKYNDENKTILAGTQEFIYAGGVGSLYENAEVNEVVFYITGNNIENLKNAIKNSKLYFKGLLVGIAGYSDIDVINSTKLSITFDSINDFVLSKDSIDDYRLSLLTNDIGYEKVGKTSLNVIIYDIQFTDVVGLTSNSQITNINIDNFEFEYFSIAPSLLDVVVKKDLNTSTLIELALINEYGSNTLDSKNSSPYIVLESLKLYVSGTDASIGDYILYNKDDSSDFVNGVYSGGNVEFDLSFLNDSNKIVGNIENYVIRVTGIDGYLNVELPKNGIIYSVSGISDSNDININLQENIDLGFRV